MFVQVEDIKNMSKRTEKRLENNHIELLKENIIMKNLKLN